MAAVSSICLETKQPECLRKTFSVKMRFTILTGLTQSFGMEGLCQQNILGKLT